MWTAFFAILFLGTLVLLFWQRRQSREARQALDITQRRLADATQSHERDLARLTGEQQALFNSMTEGVLLLDAAGRIRLANESLRQLFRLGSSVQGQTILEAFRLPALAELVQRLSAEKTVQDYEMQIPGREDRWFEINAAALSDQAGAAQGAILVFHDLTRVRQLEATQREFVANVSHELRTPLSLIKGFVETLLDGAKEDTDTADRFLRTIDKHADRLTFLIEDLLTLSRLESGQLVINRQPVNLRAETQRVLDDLQRPAADKQVRLENQVPDELGASADADRLHQVLANLVDNAIKYGRNEGTVTVSGSALDEGGVEVRVQDDGAGIPLEAQSRVFERFYRVDKARSRETGGTGLGLAIVKHIVQAHGGKLRLESIPGQGATFCFTLPAS